VGQTDNNKPTIIVRDQPPEQSEKIVLIVDKDTITLDSARLKKIETKWIKKVIALKDEKYKLLYDVKDGILVIYTKKKYHKEIKTVFEI
jgi:hypothetical protein